MVIRCAIAFVVILAVCWGALALFAWDTLRIESYTITTESLDETEHNRYMQSLDILYAQPRWVIPQDSIFRNHRQMITENLENHFPAIKSVTVTREGARAIEVAIIKRDLSYHYRVQDGTLYRIDQRGMLYEQESPDVTPERVYEHALLQDEVGVTDEVLPGAYQQTNTLLDSLDTLGVVVNRVVVVNEIEMRLYLDNGTVVVVDPSVSYDAVIETLREILPYKEFGYNFSEGEFAVPVDYINLRYGNKILYCYRADVCAGYYR